MKLQSKILLLITPVVTVSAILFGYMVFSHWSGQMKSAMDVESGSVLRQVEYSIRNHLNNTRKQLEIIANQRAVKIPIEGHRTSVSQGITYDLNNNFSLLISQYSSYTDFYIFNSALENKYHYGSKESAVWIEELVRELGKAQTKSYRKTISTDSGQFSAYISKVESFRYGKKQIVGYVVLAEDFSFFSDLLAKSDNVNKSKIFLSSKGVSIGNEDISVLSSNVESIDFKTLSLGGSGQVSVGENSFFRYIMPLSKGNSLVSYVPMEDYNSEARRMGLAIIVASILTGIFISYLLIFFINKFVVERLKKLESQSIKIAEDDLSFEFESQSHDEIGQLSRSFETMRKSILSERKKIQHMAYYDELTGMGNRRTLHEMLDSEIERSSKSQTRVCAMLIDMDEFKNINDQYGIQTGDLVLREVADRVTKTVSDNLKKFKSENISNFQCRLSGDEFAVIVSGHSDDTVPNYIASMLSSAFYNPIFVDDRMFELTVSIGVAEFPLNANNRNDLLKSANLSLREAKDGGKDQVIFFNNDIIKKHDEQKELASKIDTAIAENQFQLYYQPKVSSDRKTAKEFEALIRWFHPEEGMISPGLFIPFAEQNGQIEDISLWVVNQICKDIKSLEDDGWEDFKISFNTSPNQLKDRYFMHMLQHTVKKSKVDPRHIEMEITEYSLADDIEATIENLEEIRKIGMEVSLDDFGTGYSSLSYLEKLPINTIKIDRSFVQDCHERKSKSVIIDTVVTLAKGLGMKTVAEGVEVKDEADLVFEKGCDLVQGYYFFKPMPLAEIKNLNMAA